MVTLIATFSLVAGAGFHWVNAWMGFVGTRSREARRLIGPVPGAGMQMDPGLNWHRSSREIRCRAA